MEFAPCDPEHGVANGEYQRKDDQCEHGGFQSEPEHAESECGDGHDAGDRRDGLLVVVEAGFSERHRRDKECYAREGKGRKPRKGDVVVGDRRRREEVGREPQAVVPRKNQAYA